MSDEARPTSIRAICESTGNEIVNTKSKPELELTATLSSSHSLNEVTTEIASETSTHWWKKYWPPKGWLANWFTWRRFKIKSFD